MIRSKEMLCWTLLMEVLTGWLLMYLAHRPEVRSSVLRSLGLQRFDRVELDFADFKLFVEALRHYTHIVLDEIHERDLDMESASCVAWVDICRGTIYWDLLKSVRPLRSCDKNCRKLNGCFVLAKRCFKIKSSKERLFPVCCEMGSWPARNDSKTHFMETSISSDKSTSPSQDLLCLLLKRSLEKNPNLSHSKSCFHFRWICLQCCR